MNTDDIPVSGWYPFWKFMADEFGLTLLDSECADIVSEAAKHLSVQHKVAAMNDLIFREADYDQLASIAAACVQQMVTRFRPAGEPVRNP